MKALLTLAILLAATAVALEDPPQLEQARPPHVQIDRELQAAIVKGILANPEVSAARLRVEATHGAVTLRGSVRSADARAPAEKIARAVPGVVRVRNRLTIRAPGD